MRKQHLFFLIFLSSFFMVRAQEWEQIGNTLYGVNTTYQRWYTAFDSSDDGSIIATGEINSIWIHRYNNGVWQQMGDTLTGTFVTLDSTGTIAAIINEGIIQIYQFDGTSWIQLGQDILDNLGAPKLSSNGQRIATWTTLDGIIYQERIYEYNQENWELITNDTDILLVGQLGDLYLVNTQIPTISGDINSIAFVGWTENGDSYLVTYIYDGLQWNRSIQQIDNQIFAAYITEDGSKLLLRKTTGANKNDIYMYSYDDDSNSWTQFGNTLQRESEGYLTGYSKDANRVVMSYGFAYNPNGTGDTFCSGASWVYEFDEGSGNWTQLGEGVYGNHGYSYLDYAILSGDGKRLIPTINREDIYGNIYKGEAKVFEYSEDLNVFEEVSNQFRVYPNPTSGIVNIESNSQIKSISVYNMTGAKIKEGVKSIVDLSFLKEGTYILKIKTEDGKTLVGKVLKK